MKTVINTYLPFFPGFYESIYSNSDTGYNAIREDMDYLQELHPGANENDFDFDYKRFEAAIVENFVEAFKDYKPEFVEGIEFEALYSPRYYNYDTDRIYCNIELSDDWKNQAAEFIARNYDTLKERIRRDWSSYDGFISFIENNIEAFRVELLDNEKPLYIQILIQYWMESEYNDRGSDIFDKLYYDTMENVYDSDYIIYTKEGAK